MKTFSAFLTYLNDMPVISEEIHQNIKAVLDNDNIHPSQKLAQMSKHIRAAIKKGEDTGLEDAKPKKGSSRAVFFPKEPTKVKLDGKDAHLHTALKVAFPGHLDKYNKSGALLGEHQNMVEGDHATNHHYGILKHVGTDADGTKKYETNHEHGILAPMLHAHEEGHHIHFGKIDPIKAGDFKNLTKTKEFPKGISHQEFYDNLNHHYQEAHGNKHYGPTSEDRIKHLDDHPLVYKAHDFVFGTGSHPGDLNKRNMGVWTHPHTGEKHIVISDYGFNGDVARHYHDARREQGRRMRGW